MFMPDKPEPMPGDTVDRLHLFHDSERCIGCYSCELHCKMKNNLPIGPRLCRIIEKDQGPQSHAENGLPLPALFPLRKPVLRERLPDRRHSEACQRRDVFVDSKLCIGCKCCIAACPWGVPQWKPETGKVVKCDYCMDRIDKGLKPACVTGCLTQCLHFGRVGQASDLLRKRYAQSLEATDRAVSKVTHML